MNLQNLKTTVYQDALAKGFYQKNLSQYAYLMMIVEEMVEAMQADRAGRICSSNIPNLYAESDVMLYQKMKHFEDNIKDSLQDELADVVIRMASLAGYMDCDLMDMSRTKLYKDEWPIAVYTIPEYMLYLCRILTDKTVPLSIRLSFAISECFRLANYYGYDLEGHIEQKIVYNRVRKPHTSTHPHYD